MENYQNGPGKPKKISVDACPDGTTCKVNKPKLMQSTFSTKSKYNLAKRKVTVSDKPGKEEGGASLHMNVRDLSAEPGDIYYGKDADSPSNAPKKSYKDLETDMNKAKKKIQINKFKLK
jgi:hypothetical protein